MTTFADLVTQVSSLLHSYTGVIERATWLTADIDNATTSFAVNDANAVSVGVAEIDEELVYIDSTTGSTVVLAPFGRGYGGTAAVSHTANAKVMFDPVCPTIEVKRAINQCLAAIYPDLYQIKSTTFTFAGYQTTYDLPSDVEQIIKVSYETSGPTLYHPTMLQWEFDPDATVASGKTITVLEAPEQNKTVKVVYQANFTQFVNNTDACSDVGFPESAIDVLLYGATAKLVRFMDMSRLQIDSAENMARSQLIPVGDAGKVANSLYAMYQQRLAEERKKLLVLNPPTINYQR